MALTERKAVEIEWTDENKGREIIGRLVDYEIVQYKDGPGIVLVVQSEKAGEVFRLRGAKRLIMLLHKSDVGKRVSVRYDGEDKSKEISAGWNFPKNFTVKVEEDSLESSADGPF